MLLSTLFLRVIRLGQDSLLIQIIGSVQMLLLDDNRQVIAIYVERVIFGRAVTLVFMVLVLLVKL